jgi:hypothetical protein
VEHAIVPARLFPNVQLILRQIVRAQGLTFEVPRPLERHGVRLDAMRVPSNSIEGSLSSAS